MKVNPGTREVGKGETDTTMQDGKQRLEGGWRAKYEIGYLYRRHPTRKLNQKERDEKAAPETRVQTGGRASSRARLHCGGILPGVKMGL